MPTPKRNSIRIYFGNKDPVDGVLFETISAVSAATGLGRVAAGKRLMTLGAFAYHGYDWRVLTDRIPKQKIVWVDIVWALLRNERGLANGTPASVMTRDIDSARPAAPETEPSIGIPTDSVLEASSVQPSETGSQAQPRLNSSKLKFSGSSH